MTRVNSRLSTPKNGIGELDAFRYSINTSVTQKNRKGQEMLLPKNCGDRNGYDMPLP